jgi:hypothetical protein
LLPPPPTRCWPSSTQFTISPGGHIGMWRGPRSRTWAGRTWLRKEIDFDGMLYKRAQHLTCGGQTTSSTPCTWCCSTPQAGALRGRPIDCTLPWAQVGAESDEKLQLLVLISFFKTAGFDLLTWTSSSCF